MNEIKEIFETIQPSKKKINAQPLKIEGLNKLILIFKDVQGLAHILIEAEAYTKLESLKGIKVAYKNYTLEHTVKTKFFEYHCQHAEYHRIFFPFISDLVSIINKGIELENAHKSCFNLWKHFFENPVDSFINQQREIGLIGELLFLLKLLAKDENAIVYWKGPEGRIDFETNNSKIEVKTTLRATHCHTINGIDQLESQKLCKLFLSSFKLEMINEETENSITLFCLFQNILNLIQKDPFSTELFLNKINLLNLSQEIIKLHSFRKYILVDFRIFEVDDNFPRIIPDYFNRSLSMRVSNIRYDIDLGGLKWLDDVNLIM